MSEVKRCPACGKGNLTKLNRSIEAVCDNCGARHVDEFSRGIE